MNFSWEMVLYLLDQGIKIEDIFFRQAEEYSPYYEQAFQDMNQEYLETSDIEINSFFRFRDIFERLLNPNYPEDIEFKHYLFDIIMHYLIEIDLRKGISKRDIYIFRLRQNVRQGKYGDEITKKFISVPDTTQFRLCDYLLTQFQVGSSVFLFSATVRLLFPESIIYINNLNTKQILVYLGEQKSGECGKKIELVEDLFLPIGYFLRIFYQHHFGVFGVAETLRLGDIEIF